MTRSERSTTRSLVVRDPLEGIRIVVERVDLWVKPERTALVALLHWPKRKTDLTAARASAI
jgi:hypothetical protein